MLTLLQLFLPEIATHQGVTALIHPHKRSADRSCRSVPPSTPAVPDRRENPIPPSRIATSTAALEHACKVGQAHAESLLLISGRA